ncbi:RNA polymerase II CTD phosphatase Fcp1 [Drechmeria coniospora]|uniref:RNA polymerase II subunit A C-terminal domain phosphatase n=1 Tax=Drechmeria coniospora TaxID=98403 RepID=A0A151GYD7_DRECN|nr:RNA polymerase II CTD phosphatase Fcp1 [Drechmeria coniospora]KYK62129.1 RNA polymerase II CTD phosphatase Fcp1 [Drechmeria coniospora]
MYDKVVSLGSRLHYPITITKLLKSPGDALRKQENIVEYKFGWRRRVNDDEWVDETTYTEFDSPAEGKLKEWRIREGQVIGADTPCMTVEEACGHEVQIQGLCSLCGADMTEVNWASEEKDTDRAMINMTHDQTGLMVSENVAKKAEHDTQRRLLRQRKLSLVVDLDQTIIHACIEPTIGEWQADPSNPNHQSVEDVKSFQLNDDGPAGLASGCTYYIKLRPGLRDFLREVAAMYELHVYTMGTRAYALNIARIVDPDRKLFGNRVISRDENGNITSKSLQRLFPVSTNMVVIIDDRADVWPRNRPNLIKVVPYDFFKGIGDINSSFLPKRTDILPAASPQPLAAAAAAAAAAPDAQGGSPEAKASPLDELARMGGADDEASLELQAREQEKTLEKQLVDRPLLHMQEELDKEDELSAQASDDAGGAPAHHARHRLLSDDDEELMALQDHLTDLHTAFYETYDRRRDDRKQSEPTHPPGHARVRRRSVDDGVDLSMVPDVGDILDELKSNVLSGLVIVLSGLVPLGVDVESSEIGMQAQNFGAQVLDGVSRRVTHLVVSTSRPRTKKVQQAAKIPTIKIVNQNWLVDCLSQWRRLEESPYFLDILDQDREKSDDSTEPSSEAEDEEANDLKGFDWDMADKDLEEFLDDDGDDNDDDDGGDEDESDGAESGGDAETASVGTTDSRKARKRKKAADGDDSDADGSVAGESLLAKKQRLSRGRGTSALRSVQTLNNGDSASNGDGASQTTHDNFDDDLERDLLAELEAAEA